MFGKSFKLFTLFGFEIKVDLSWIVIAVLIAWTFANGLFPATVEGLTTATYWWMGVAAATGLFLSIIFHELWHSLIARRYGLQMKGITLFIFGGVSEMTEEPKSARVEFWMALAGPLSSVILAGVFYGAYGLARGAILPEPRAVTEVFRNLGYLNLLLAGFNILPAFPLDGGRVLRAAIWAANKNMLSATRIASLVGSAFGVLLIGGGILLALFLGNPIAGIWYALIGWFLWTAARSSYQQVLVRKGLEGITVAKLMEAKPVTVPRALSVERLVDDYIYKHTFKMYPVVDGDRLAGCVTLQKVKDVPRTEWGVTTVGAIAAGCAPDNTISPSADAMEALAQMSRGRVSRLMVVDGDRLVGIITLKDMLEFLSVKLELQDHK
ncbi:MAG: site-2 protease family protein [Chloroflexi bacterium]|nr:site-2 protease family protein [Chloroflexota bacterium]